MILANLVLRWSLLGFVLWNGRWYFGDAYSYLYYAGEVCSGQWGGEPGRPPLYLWFLCSLSPSIGRPGTAGQLFLPLLLQTTIVWAVGWWMSRRGKSGRRSALFWLYDPVALLYSTFAMTDALFAVVLLGYLWAFFRDLNKETVFSNRLVGFCGAILALMRPNGIVILTASTVLFFIRKGISLLSLRRWLGAFAICMLLLAPRLYWNATHGSSWTIAVQGDGWLASVAGVVASHGKNLDAHQAEEAWFAEKGPSPTREEAVKTLLSRWPVTTWLTMKGMARVLLGHINMEWWYFFSGHTPVGPSWFKPPESRQDAPLSRVELVVWVAGIAALMAWALLFYRQVFLFLRVKVSKTSRLEQGWLLAMAALMTALPLVYGEARFRLAVWPFLFMILLRERHEASAKS